MNNNNKSESATKADLQELAQTTKTDLTDGLAELKIELNKKIDSVAQNLGIELAKTQADVREIKYDIATKLSTKDDINRIMNHIDKFAAEALSYRNHDALRGRAIMDHTTKLSDHENRLQKLEAE